LIGVKHWNANLRSKGQDHPEPLINAFPTATAMSESQNTEWKESWRDDYIKWLCGFANAAGGVLIVGRNDKGDAIGINNAHELLEIIPNKVRDLLGIIVDVNLLKVQELELLEIVVEPYPNPISYKGQYHYRSGSIKQELEGAALDQFLLKKKGKRWDGVPVPYVNAADLDDRSLAEFRRLATRSKRLSLDILQEPDAVLLEKLHLLEGDYLKRAALLLFHPDPERFVTGACIKIGFFESNVHLLYQDEVQGSLITQVNQVVDILSTKYLKALISYDGLQRVETWPVPEPALREAIINAVVHKDYASGAPIQISVYADKLMIWNPGVLPQDWDVAKLLGKHASQPFNPDVANAFFRAGMIESWGQGIERIMDSCLEAGTPVPELRYEATGLWVVFNFLPEKTTQKTTQKTTGKTHPETPPKTPQMILEVLKIAPSLTGPEIANQIGKSDSAVKRAIKKLREDGKLERIGPAKGGHWKVLGDKE